MNMQDIHQGMKVHASDGANLGKVVEMNEESFIIEKGFFFPKEYVARYQQIGDIRDDEIWLRESGTDLREGATGAEAGEAYEAREAREGERERISGSREEVVVPLAEEQIETRTTEREVGDVRVRKDVVTEEQDIEVPVRREEVHVERVPATGEAAEARFEGGETRIPIHEEEVEVTTRPVVKEELRVSKSVKEDTESVRAKTRRETAEVDEENLGEEHRHPR